MPRPARIKFAKDLLARFQSVAALALVLIALCVAAGSWDGLQTFWAKFLTVDNGLNVLRQISINLCLSIGMTLVILTAGIDLSVGAVLALSAAVAAGLLKNGVLLPRFGVALQFTVFGAIIAGALTGMLLGAINGLVITRFGVPPFVATLGMLSAARGLTMLWTGGFPVTGLGGHFAAMEEPQALAEDVRAFYRSLPERL